MRQVLKFFQYPFVEGSAILMVLWCFSSLVDFVAYLLYGMPMFAFYYALHGLVIAYMLVLIHKVLSTGTLRRIYDWALLGFGLTLTYNGERGKQNKLVNYLFYPVHLLILGIIRMYLGI